MPERHVAVAITRESSYRGRPAPGAALAVAVAGLLSVMAVAHAQTRWVVDPKTSLAWWQVSPHLNHLWATTCPAEPSWRPGEGRSSGWNINPLLKLPSTGYANVEDTVHVPLFPRHWVNPVCAEAVRGDVVVGDTLHWRGVHGAISVRSDALITGESIRDRLMHELLQTAQFPEIVFTVDSLVGVSKLADTLLGHAVGTLTVLGVPSPTTATVRVFPDAGGMRVLVKWRAPAWILADLTPKIHYYALGLDAMIWKDLFMGADLVLRSEPTHGS
jgi:polyisoprenoid-binding protein YceI